jgi:hypothetical protein
VLLNNIAKLSDYTSQFFYSLDQGLSWALVNPRNPPVLWLKDLPLIQLRPAKGLQGSLDFSLGNTQPKEGEKGDKVSGRNVLHYTSTLYL